MNARTVLLLAVAVSAAGFWIWRQNQLQQLRAEIRDLGRRHGSLASTARSVDAAAASIDTNELIRLRGVRSELAKLRASLPQLRQTAKQTSAQLESRAAEIAKEAALVRAELAADEQSKRVAECISSAHHLMITAGRYGGDLLAGSWEAVRAQLAAPVRTNRTDSDMWLQVMQENAKPGGWMAEIEVLPHVAGLRLKEAESDGRVLMLRERQPRPVPRGGWARFYAWANGRIEEVRQADSNFTAWEQKQTEVSISDR